MMEPPVDSGNQIYCLGISKFNKLEVSEYHATIPRGLELMTYMEIRHASENTEELTILTKHHFRISVTK